MHVSPTTFVVDPACHVWRWRLRQEAAVVPYRSREVKRADENMKHRTKREKNGREGGRGGGGRGGTKGKV